LQLLQKTPIIAMVLDFATTCMKTYHLRETVPAHNRAFTLVELQIAIAVIALMAAIAVPQVCRITNQAQAAKERANAQNVCSAAAAASAAGVMFTDLDSAVSALTSREGSVVAAGAVLEARYNLSSLTAGEVAGAKRHLRFSDGQLTVAP
jgi:prepilin-type N-terminal cleavage/methylation domain-containing protein